MWACGPGVVERLALLLLFFRFLLGSWGEEVEIGHRNSSAAPRASSGDASAASGGTLAACRLRALPFRSITRCAAHVCDHAARFDSVRSWWSQRLRGVLWARQAQLAVAALLRQANGTVPREL